MFELWRGKEGDLSECAHSSAEVLSVKMRCRVFPPSLSPSPAASGLCLCDANCFCYLCQVPTLPQHILQTGPGPSAAFCVCLRNEKMCAAICSEHTTVPPPGRDCQSATMIHIHTHSLSEVEKTMWWGNKKTKLTHTTANMKQNNSRGSCFDAFSALEGRHCTFGRGF